MRTLRAAVASAAVALVLTACSVGPQDHPDVVMTGPLTAPLRPATPGDGSRAAIGSVFFLLGGRLVAVTRKLTPGDELGSAIAELAVGPTAADPAGLRSAWPDTTGPPQVSRTGGLVTIEVPPGFDRIGARNEILALGQLVFTAMAQPGVAGVSLTAGGTPIEVPVDSGRLVRRPVTRADYPSIAPL